MGKGGFIVVGVIEKLRKLAAILRVLVWRDALWRHRVAAGVEHAGILKTLGTVHMIVDIGANRGQFALAARHYFPSAQIVSFEPLPVPAAVYRSVFACDGRAILHEAAIAPVAGEATIHISQCDDSSSLLPITAAQRALFPGTQEVKTSVVEIGPLAVYLIPEAIEGPGLLKLDVQGFELKALAGCENLLGYFTWVYVECSFMELYDDQAFADEVIAWLRERSFRLCGVYNMVYDSEGSAVQADFLFKMSASEQLAGRS